MFRLRRQIKQNKQMSALQDLSPPVANYLPFLPLFLPFVVLFFCDPYLGEQNGKYTIAFSLPCLYGYAHF